MNLFLKMPYEKRTTRKKYTVRNEFEFPGNQTVGLPTLVQNPPTANDIANPTGLDRRLIHVWFGLLATRWFWLLVKVKKVKKGKREKTKKKKKNEKKDCPTRESTSQTLDPANSYILSTALSTGLWCLIENLIILFIEKVVVLTGKPVLFWFGSRLTE
jgi:hypothetical protein